MVLRELHAHTVRRMGPYDLLARLGSGGMGEVFLGADGRPQPGGGDGTPRLAAVKTVRADLARDQDFRDRFRREIETARAVRTRFTARLLGGDADARTPWLATEYVPAPTLEQAVRAHGPLPLDVVRGLGADLAQTLRAIHHARVLHRDLKPANVLLAAAGPKVIDFGIARAFGAGTLTATGLMIGSPGFMSPEHVAGSREVVAASDVFCLASLLCYAATGRSPFGDGPLAAVLYRISQAEADLTSVPPELRELLADCLHLDPAARPDTVELERRLTSLRADGIAEHPGRPPWPGPVRELIGTYEAELARVVAESAPVASPPPTMPGASPVHSAPTVTGPPPKPPKPPKPPGPPGAPEPPARRRPRARHLVLIGAGALALGVLAAFGLRALGDDGGGDGKGNETGGQQADDGQRAGDAAGKPSVDVFGGPDRSRIFRAAASERPEGWRPWTAELAAGPSACALNDVLLVCRLEDGSLQALGAANGEERWRTEGAGNDGSSVALSGGIVVSAEEGAVRGRGASDGEVRWEQELPDGALPAGRVLIGDDRAYLALRTGADIGIHAYDVADGEPLWKEAVALGAASAEEDGPLSVPLAHASGKLYVETEPGLVALDDSTGEQLAEAAGPGAGSGPDGCGGLRLSAGELLCPGGSDGYTKLDARTLRQVEIPHGGAFPGADPSPHLVGSIGTTLETGRYMLVTEVAEDRVVIVQETGEGRVIGRIPDHGQGDQVPVSVPVVVGDTAVYADNEALYTLSLDAGGPRRTAVEGAPGNDGAGRSTAPQVLSIGGMLCVLYGDGTVSSLELPVL